MSMGILPILMSPVALVKREEHMSMINNIRASVLNFAASKGVDVDATVEKAIKGMHKVTQTAASLQALNLEIQNHVNDKLAEVTGSEMLEVFGTMTANSIQGWKAISESTNPEEAFDILTNLYKDSKNVADDVLEVAIKKDMATVLSKVRKAADKTAEFVGQLETDLDNM